MVHKIVLLLLLCACDGMAAPSDSGPLFPTLVDSSQNSSAPTKSTAGDAASGKTGSTHFVFKDSSGNIILPQLLTDGSIPVYSPGFSTSSNTRPSVTSTDSTILAANSNRKYAYINNNSGMQIWLKFGAAAVVNQGISLNNASAYEINSNNLFQGAIHAIKSGGGSATIDVFEGTP